jgi:hypothetical protein
MKRKKIVDKLRKAYIKSLYAFAHGMIAKGYELEDKVILLELELREKESANAQTDGV